MDKISYEELDEMVAWARERIELGSRWKHYKGGEYAVNDVAIIESTNEVAVVYVRIDHPTISFVRPLDVWFESVEYNGSTVPRFSKLS